MYTCNSRKYLYPPLPRKVFCFVLHLLPSPPPPQVNNYSSLALYFASNILTFKSPLPLGIFDDLPWGGYGFFSGTTQSTNGAHSQDVHS